MCYNNTWGTICGDTWTINEAVVVCNGLGFYGNNYISTTESDNVHHCVTAYSMQSYADSAYEEYTDAYH